MTARRAVAFVALAATCGLTRTSPAAEAPAAEVPSAAATLAMKPSEAAPSETYPLVLLVQGDAVVDGTPSDNGAAAGNDPPGGGSEVRLRRLRFGEDVRRGAWRARVIIEASSRDSAFVPAEGGRLPLARFVRLTEAFAAWRPHRAFELDAGAQRVPFSLSRQVDEADLRLPERAQALVALAPDYRAGLAFASDLGLLNLRVAGMSADRNLDTGLASSGFFGAARLGADPIGPMGLTPWRRRTDDPWYGWRRFSAGVSVLYGTLFAPRTLALGADAQLQWRRVTVTGEYVGQHVAAARSVWPSQGAVVEPGIFIARERLELVLRGAWYEQPLTALTGATSADTLAAGAGLTFFALDAHVRLQAGLELRRTLDARLPDSGWAIMRATLAL
jgi:hypothetical protein